MFGVRKVSPVSISRLFQRFSALVPTEAELSHKPFQRLAFLVKIAQPALVILATLPCLCFRLNDRVACWFLRGLPTDLETEVPCFHCSLGLQKSVHFSPCHGKHLLIILRIKLLFHTQGPVEKPISSLIAITYFFN